MRVRSITTSVRLPAVAIAVALLAGCGSTKTVTVTESMTTTVTETTTETTTVPVPPAASACNGSDLTGSLGTVPGSAGAGSITYMLTLTNSSRRNCYVSGIPELQLLDAAGHPLPTHAVAAQPGRATAAKIVLDPGKSASADARFSPDVPGPGEPAVAPAPGQPGSCEPVAHELRVTVGDGSVDVPIRPPTSVCSHGVMRLSLLTAA